MINKYLLPAIVSLGAFFAPTFHFILLAGFLISVDCITAVIAAHKRGEPITSAKLSRTIGKFLVYGLAILTAHTVNVFFLKGIPILQGFALFITFVEVKSIDENIKKYTGYSLFAVILDKLKPKK